MDSPLGNCRRTTLIGNAPEIVGNMLLCNTMLFPSAPCRDVRDAFKILRNRAVHAEALG